MKRFFAGLAFSVLAAAASAQVTFPPQSSGGSAFDGGTITTPILGPTGCTTSAYSFTDDPDAGLCLPAAGSLRLSTNNTTSTSTGHLEVKSTSGGFFFLNASGVATAGINLLDGTTDLYTGSAGATVLLARALSTELRVGSGQQFTWSSNANPTIAAADTGLARSESGRVKVTNGSTGQGNFEILASLYFGAALDTQLVRVDNNRLSVHDISTGMGYITSGQVVEVNATTKAPTANESGELYTNTGDADGSTINLPNDPKIGAQFRVALTVAQTVTINAATGETIQDVGTSGTSTSAGAIGDTIHLIAVTGGSGAIWMVVSKTGTWTTT